MLIIAIDDEQRMLALLHRTIQEAAPEATVRPFLGGRQAIEAIRAEGLQPNYIFSDIVMPELDGLELAVQLRTAVPGAKLVFVTGYQDYAFNAYQLHAKGYIMKPPDVERIREELNQTEASEPAERPADRLQVRCFGSFEAFWKGKPLSFGRQKTKEMLAYLVDRRGSYVSAEEIIAALWEEDGELKAAKQKVRNLVSDLRSTLGAVGLSEILLRKRNQLAILTDRIDCDYYRMLDGDMDAVNDFCGEYMSQYSWAEITEGALCFRTGMTGME